LEAIKKSLEPILIDIIILSYAKTDVLKKLTEQTIATCIQSEKKSEIKFNIVVIESHKTLKPFQFKNTKTIYPNIKFGFHRYLNIGVKNTASDYVCFCNNDLIFHKNWASEILNAMRTDDKLISANTLCPKFHEDKLANYESDISYGYQNGIFFTGWCFFLKRSVFETIGLFDEKFEFWFSDDDFRLTLEKFNVKNALIRKSRVTHLRSETLEYVGDQKKTYLMYSSFAYYKYKWQHHNYFKYIFESLKYKLKILLAG
jgi:GT2 family glycosyltransferase